MNESGSPDGLAERKRVRKERAREREREREEVPKVFRIIHDIDNLSGLE